MKMYLVGGYQYVAMCWKYPQEVRQLVKKYFTDQKATKERAKEKRTEVDR